MLKALSQVCVCVCVYLPTTWCSTEAPVILKQKSQACLTQLHQFVPASTSSSLSSSSTSTSLFLVWPSSLHSSRSRQLNIMRANKDQRFRNNNNNNNKWSRARMRCLSVAATRQAHSIARTSTCCQPGCCDTHLPGRLLNDRATALRSGAAL